jgi:hypothetical protein
MCSTRDDSKSRVISSGTHVENVSKYKVRALGESPNPAHYDHRNILGIMPNAPTLVPVTLASAGRTASFSWCVS